MGRAQSADITLGSVTVPSGILVIGDMGYLGSWSGRASPGVPPEIEEPERRRRYEGSKDLRIVGSDADRAARAFDRQSQTFLYDTFEEDEMRALFAREVGDRGFDARLETEPRRVPHRTRALRAAAGGGADFILWGVAFAAVGGFPRAARFPVVGHLRDYGPPVGERWEAVEVRVSDKRASTATIGDVGVDWARLIFADLDALELWEHEEPLDGQADVAFWGADAEECAAAFGAGRIPEGAFGWEDLDVHDAADLAVEVDEWKAANGKRLVRDFRPHSHHYRVMREVRASEHEVGHLALGEADVLGLMTSWGDGIFGVEVDRTARGELVAVRVAFGAEERRNRLADLIT